MDQCLEHSAHERAIALHDKRLEAHGGEIDELRECVVRLTAIQEANTAWQTAAEERIAALEAAPAKRWDSVVNYALGTLAVALGALGLVFAITFGAIDPDALTGAVAAVLAIGTTVVAWWRNNNMTEAAQDAQKVLDSLKDKE